MYIQYCLFLASKVRIWSMLDSPHDIYMMNYLLFFIYNDAIVGNIQQWYFDLAIQYFQDSKQWIFPAIILDFESFFCIELRFIQIKSFIVIRIRMTVCRKESYLKYIIFCLYSLFVIMYFWHTDQCTFVLLK